MNAIHFEKEIRKGTGRAYLLMRDCYEPAFDEILFSACIHNFDYDPQIAGERSVSLFEMIRLLPHPNNFENRLLDWLLKSDLEFWGQLQVFNLAKLMAQNGHLHAREVMYKKFSDLYDAREETVGENEIVELDGFRGLEFIAEKVGHLFLTENIEEEDKFGFFVFVEEEVMPEKDIDHFLEEKSKSNECVKAYWEAVQKHRKWLKSFDKKRKVWSYHDLRSRIDSLKEEHFMIAKRVPLESIERLAHEFQSETDEHKIKNFLKMFSQVPNPLGFEDMFKYSRSENERIRCFAIESLGHFAHDDIRKLMLKNLNEGRDVAASFYLLEKNFLSEDAHLVEGLLMKENDEDEVHRMGMSIRNILERNPLVELYDAVVFLYQKSTCALCRNSFVDILIQWKKIPDWILEEAAYDCYLETRKAVANYLK